MKIFVLEKKEIEDFKGFITYWAELYFDKNEPLYIENISKSQFTTENLNLLFEWKNQMKLSSPKQKSLNEKIVLKLDLINQYKNSDKIKEDNFLKDFKSVTAVWKLFLLHTIKPDDYPIYDQHVHRCYNILHELPFGSIKANMPDNEKIDFYFKKYIPFIQKVSNDHTIPIKRVDEAFVSLGQFFSSKINQQLIFGHIAQEK